MTPQQLKGSTKNDQQQEPRPSQAGYWEIRLAQLALESAIKAAGEALETAYQDDLWLDVPLRLQTAAERVMDARQALTALQETQKP